MKIIPFGIMHHYVLYGLPTDKMYYSQVGVYHKGIITKMRKYGVLNDNDYSVWKRLLSGFFVQFGL